MPYGFTQVPPEIQENLRTDAIRIQKLKMDMAKDSQVRIETPMEMKRYMNDRLRKSEIQGRFNN